MLRGKLHLEGLRGALRCILSLTTHLSVSVCLKRKLVPHPLFDRIVLTIALSVMDKLQAIMQITKRSDRIQWTPIAS